MTAGVRGVVIGLVVALTASLIGVTVLWLDRDETVAPLSAPPSLTSVENDAELAARAAVEQMTTYDYRTVDDDFTWVEDAGTEQFQTYFEDAGADSKRVIEALKATATGTVVDSAATAIDATHVKVLLFVDQEISAAKQNGAKLDQPRVTMQMVLQDGRWLVDEVAVNNLLG
ncbi:MAG: hypothetical protein WB767_06530 [Nocardioides sp.]